MKQRPSVFYAPDDVDSGIHHRINESKTEKVAHDQANAEREMGSEKIQEILRDAMQDESKADPEQSSDAYGQPSAANSHNEQTDSIRGQGDGSNPAFGDGGVTPNATQGQENEVNTPPMGGNEGGIPFGMTLNVTPQPEATYGPGTNGFTGATNLLYQFTNGDVNLRGISGEHNAGENLAEAMVEYAKHPWKTSENSFYENLQRANKVMAVTSFIMGDYNAVDKAQKFDSLDTSMIQSGMDVYSRAGFGYAAENKMNNHLCDCMFAIKDNDGNVTYKSGKELAFTGKQISDLANNGCVVYQDGVLEFQNQGDSKTFAANYAASLQEGVKRDQFLNPHTVQEKAHALDMARSALVSELKQDDAFATFMDMTQKPENMAKSAFIELECDKASSMLHGQIMTEINSQAVLLNELGYSSAHNTINDAYLQGDPKYEELIRKNCELDALNLDTEISKMTGEMKQLSGMKKDLQDNITDKSRELNGVVNGKMNPPDGMSKDAYVKKLTDEITELRKQNDHLDKKMNLLNDDLQKRQNVKDKIKKSSRIIEKKTSQLTNVAECRKTACDNGNEHRRSYGARIVANKFLGSDMVFGFETYRRMAKMADMGIRTIHRASCGFEVKFLEQHQNLATSRFLGKGAYQDQLKFADAENKFYLNAKKSGDLKNYKDQRKVRLESRKMAINNKNVAKRRERLNLLEDKEKKGKYLSKEEKSELEQLRKQVAMDEKRAGKRIRKDEVKKERLDAKNARRSKSAEKKQARREKFHDSRWGKRLGKARELVDKFKNSRVGKVLNAIRDPLAALKNAIVTRIKAKLGLPLGAMAMSFLMFLLKISMMASVIIIVVFFVSEILDGTHLTESLDAGMEGMNYTQIIVNDTASKMANSFKTVAERDAYSHYASMNKEQLDAAYNAGDTAVKSDKYDWYRGINKGKISDILYMETESSTSPTSGWTYHQKAMSVNDNIVPITSMMHYRFLDEIGYLNWRNAKGYVFFMYAKSHYVDGYEAKAEDDCSVIYNVPWDPKTSLSESGGKYIVSRPTGSQLKCGNVYVHGYDKEKYANDRYETFRTQNGLDLATAFYTSVADAFEGLWSTFFDEKTEANQGIKVDDWDGSYSYGKANFTKPKDSVGECTDAVAVGVDKLTQKRKVETKFDLSTFAFTDNYNETLWRAAYNAGRSNYLICPGYEHKHNPVGCIDDSCWKFDSSLLIWTTTKPIHTHGAEAGDEIPCAYTVCYNTKDKHGNWVNADHTGYEHTHGAACIGSCKLYPHTHDNSCCSKPEHTHDWQCSKGFSLNVSAEACADGHSHEPNSWDVNASGTNCKWCGKWGYIYYNCGKEAHKHGDGNCDAMACPNKLDKDGNYVNADMSGYEHTHGDDCCDLIAHTHDRNCCGISYHKHTPSVCHWPNGAAYSSCSNDNVHYSKKEHVHLPWQSASEPGCYQTVWICPGHCGGHMTPQVTVMQDMTYENLVYYDIYKVPKGKHLQEDDFKIDGIGLFNKGNEGGLSDSFVTVNAWKAFWDQRALNWFSPFHTTPMATLQSLGHSIHYGMANVIDAVSGFFGKVVGFFTGMDVDISSEEAVTSDIADMRDAGIVDEYGFVGWFQKDENGKEIVDSHGDHVHDPKVLETVDSMYPAADNYREAIENWEDIGEVRFPIGSTRTFTDQEIDDIMTNVASTVSDDNKKIVRAALKSVGKYSFDLEKTVFASAGRGITDNPKYVSQMLYTIGGDDYPNTYLKTVSQWESMARNGIGYEPGYVIVNQEAHIGTNPNDEEEEIFGDVAVWIGPVQKIGKDKYVAKGTPGSTTVYLIVHNIPGMGCSVEEVGAMEILKNWEKMDVQRFVK